jgi:ribonuclease Z
MTILGSPATLDVVVRRVAGLWGEGRAPIPLELVPLTEEGQIIDAGEFTIVCFPVRHRETDSFGFSFESRAPRHLRPDRLEILGVPDGPLRGELALGLPERGKKLVIIGDAETTEGLAERVRHADVLVIEATFLQCDASIAGDSS